MKINESIINKLAEKHVNRYWDDFWIYRDERMICKKDFVAGFNAAIEYLINNKIDILSWNQEN